LTSLQLAYPAHADQHARSHHPLFFCFSHTPLRKGIRDERTADGVLNLMYDGTEYANIPPVWNYLQLPGTVIRQAGPTPDCDTVTQHSPFAFVGGVSTGELGAGASAQRLEGRGLSQLRAWFFFDHAVVAVSENRTLAEHADDPSASVVMTLASQALQGAVTAKLVGQSAAALAHGNRTVPAGSLEWLHHKETLYVCLSAPCAHAVTVINANASGDWSTLGAGSGRVNTPLFHAAVDLGEAPPNMVAAAGAGGDLAGYIVVPNTPVGVADTVAKSFAGVRVVVANDTSLAVGAVRDADASGHATVAGGVFPSDVGGTLDFGSGLKVGVNAGECLFARALAQTHTQTHTHTHTHIAESTVCL
jgi:hypothetical protein